MLLRPLLASLTASLALAAAPVRAAAPVTDCPNRTAPFSASSPLVDLLLSEPARALLRPVLPGLDKAPPQFLGTQPPTFAAILTLREARGFAGVSLDAVNAIDAQLRQLPVTPADQIARCARFDNEVPTVTRVAGKSNILVFEKINGFKDTPSVDAAHAMLLAMAARKGWAITFTDRGGAFNPKTLAKVDAVLWNNVSGDVLTLSQRAAFQTWLTRGGAFIGIHGAAGDPVYFWDWYPDRLIGARFAGHPRTQQFQQATVRVNAQHPLAKGLPTDWSMTEEWYSFKSNPRLAGAQPVLLLDESTYAPNDPQMPELVMGADHPVAWTNCLGRGRVFYSALGHRPENYGLAPHVTLLENAITWAATDRRACRGTAR
ncbi:ThuA domain-containing protein [Novosphingobium piscinae]|uniref:ThuA domain-containing protein n=1 Tax=Novosphingobium piscinae TaxID=1507448 RepID=A0A7X1FVD7_9SPHN|nr:ThuA domain-containing protein [Novosphingobium piscinae]MBC2667675.1 ThuA domain-containing protein [Novosphingobium piscinae]